MNTIHILRSIDSQILESHPFFPYGKLNRICICIYYIRSFLGSWMIFVFGHYWEAEWYLYLYSVISGNRIRFVFVFETKWYSYSHLVIETLFAHLCFLTIIIWLQWNVEKEMAQDMMAISNIWKPPPPLAPLYSWAFVSGQHWGGGGGGAWQDTLPPVSLGVRTLNPQHLVTKTLPASSLPSPWTSTASPSSSTSCRGPARTSPMTATSSSTTFFSGFASSRKLLSLSKIRFFLSKKKESAFVQGFCVRRLRLRRTGKDDDRMASFYQMLLLLFQRKLTITVKNTCNFSTWILDDAIYLSHFTCFLLTIKDMTHPEFQRNCRAKVVLPN